MNTSKLARTTFVLDLDTHEQLSYVARRSGVSRSVLVRDLLAEPVAMMAGWFRQVPEGVSLSPETAASLLGTLQADLTAFVDRKSSEIEGLGHG